MPQQTFMLYRMQHTSASTKR